MTIQTKLFVCLLKASIFVCFYFVITSYYSVYAASYCGDALRIDTFKCDFVPAAGSIPSGCNKVLVNDHYIAPCTGNPNNCFTRDPVFGSSGSCKLIESTTPYCIRIPEKATCWVNPGDDPPPPPPSNNKCGVPCTDANQCGGLKCAPAGVCWDSVCDTGNAEPNHRVRVKVLNCNDKPVSNVKVVASGWNGCTTNNDGECVVEKGKVCKEGNLWETSILVGHDADSSDPNYYSSVADPPFERGSCGTINCNYNNSSTMSSPYRQAYYISPSGKTLDTFIYQFCATSDEGANYGFNFKQINCNVAPDCSITGPDTVTAGQPYTWSVSASDTEGKLNYFGAYLHTSLPVTANNTTNLYWHNPQADFGSATSSTSSWTCNTPGTYYLSCNAADTAGSKCGGYSADSDPRCASGKDRLTVTCKNICSGVAISCVGVCATGGYTANCSWTKPTGATNFKLQTKEHLKTEWVTESSNTGNVSTFSKTYNDLISRDYRLKIKESTACIPNTDDASGGYGSASTVWVSTLGCIGDCVGPPISCGGTCNSSGSGYTANCSWTKPTGATNFLMQYKLSSVSNWTTDSSTTGNVTNWSKSFETDESRDFRLKIKTSSNCTPFADDAGSGYGDKYTIASPVCTFICPGISISCTNACNANNGYDVTCNWTKPTYANNFDMQFKNFTSTTWTTASTGNVSTWSKSFADPSSARDFKLRISSVTSAATCTVGATAFGPVNSVGALTCTVDAAPNLTFDPATSTCADAPFALSATASDSDGIQKVEFFYKRNNQTNWTLAYSDTSSPYEYTIPSNTFTAGSTYNLRAVATDKDTPSQSTTVDKNITVKTVANCSGGTNSFTISKVKTSTKAVPDSGNTITFRIDVENTGTNTLTDLDITDTVPSYTTFKSASSTSGWSCVNNNAGSNCTFPRQASLAPGTTFSVTYAVTVTNNYKQPGIDMGTSNTACAVFTGQSQQCATVNVDLVDQPAGSTSISIDKTLNTDKSATASAGFAAGNLVVFDLKITNTSTTSPLSNIVITEVVPANMTFVANQSSSGWVCTNGNCSLSLGTTSINAGDNRTYEFAAKVRNNYVPTAGQDMTTSNTTCVSATNASEVCDTLLVDLADADDTGETLTLGITKTISTANSTPNPPYNAGEKIAFAIQIDNNNMTSVTGLSVVDDVPQYTTFDAATSNSLSPGNATWSCNTSNTCTFNAGNLNASSSKTVYFVVDVNSGYTPGAGNMKTNNEACVTSNEVTTAVCDDIDADLVDAVNTSASLTVTHTIDTVKSGKTEPYIASDIVITQVLVSNTSTSQATNVVLTNTIAGNKAKQQVSNANSYNADVWTCSTNKICTYSLGNIAANSTKTVYFAEVINTYTAPISADASTTTNACASGTNVTEACGGVTIDLVDNISAPSFSINQTIVNNSSAPFDANDDIQFSVEVTNTGNVQLSNVAISDQLSNLVTFNDSATTSNWNCSGSNCSINVGFLNAGATYTADIVLKVKPDYFTIGGFNYGDDAKDNNRVTATEALLPSVSDSATFDLVDLTTQPTTFVGYIHYLEEGQNCGDIADSNRLTADKLDLVSGQNPRVLFEFDDTPSTSVNINPYSYTNGFDTSSLRDIPLPPVTNVKVKINNLNNLKPALPGEFEFPCARLNGSTMPKANANSTANKTVNVGATNTVLIGLRIKPFKPWFQLDTGDIYTGGVVTQTLPTPLSPKMITNVGNLFSNSGGFTDFSAKGVRVTDFITGGARTWLDEYGFSSSGGINLQSGDSNLENKIYKGSVSTLNAWLTSHSSYSVANDGLAVYFVTGSGDITFGNSNGLTSSNNGRLLIVTKNDVVFNPSFGENVSSSVAGEFGILAEGTIDFVHQTGVNPVSNILRLDGVFASGTGGGINITRRCALNETQPSIIFNYDDRYYEKIIDLENSTSYGLGMSQVEVTKWEVLD